MMFTFAMFHLFAVFGFDDFAIGLAVAAAGAAMSAYASSSTKYPKPQGYGEINAGAIKADADTLALRRELESAGRLGIKSDVPTGGVVPVKATKQFVTVPPYALTAQQRQEMNIPANSAAPVELEYNAADWQPGGKFNRTGTAQAPQPFSREVITGYEPSKETVDFTGYGDADIQAKVAAQMAPMMLELEKEYGPQFIAQAKAMQEQADPDGTEARKMLADLINTEAQATPDRPIAELLDQQVGDALAAGSGMTAEESGITDKLLQDQVGNDAELAAIKDSLVTGAVGYNRRATGQQTATGWLASGATPEDVEYRRRQQSMANQASFIRGQTPTAQFGQLSAAQTGAAPVVFGQPLASVNPNVTGKFANAAANKYAEMGNIASQQADPWFAGLSTTIKGVGGVLAAKRN